MRADLTVRWSGPDGGGCENIHIECTEQEYRLIEQRLPDLRAQSEDAMAGRRGGLDELEIAPHREPTVLSAQDGIDLVASLVGVGDDWPLAEPGLAATSRQERYRGADRTNQERPMKAVEFRKIFCAEMRCLNYLETWEGKGPLLQGYKYPKGGGCPLLETHWSVDITVVGGKTAVATLRDGSQKRVAIGDDPAAVAREIVAWMGITS